MGPFRVLADMVVGQADPSEVRQTVEHFWENRRVGNVLFAGSTRQVVVRTLASAIEQRLQSGARRTAGSLPSPLASAYLASAQVGLVEGSDDAVVTPIALANVDDEGRASYTFELEWRLPELTDEALAKYGHLHTGSFAATLAPGADGVLQAVTSAADHATFSYDPNIRPALMGAPDLVRGRVEQLVAAAAVVGRVAMVVVAAAVVAAAVAARVGAGVVATVVVALVVVAIVVVVVVVVAALQPQSWQPLALL